jgi:type IV secretory pathway VirB10-like protein
MSEPSKESESLPRKELVKRSALGALVMIGFLILAVVGSRKPAITLESPNQGMPSAAQTGASPGAFSGPTSRNPWTPEQTDRPQAPETDLSADQLLQALADQNTSTGRPNVMPTADPYQSYAAPATPPQPIANNSIGTIDMRPPAPPQAPTVSNGPRTLAPGVIVRIRLNGAISTDFPNSSWLGVVTQDVPVRDGSIGIPAGSQVLGTVSTFTGPNRVLQSRAPLAASTIILPNGTLVSPVGDITDADGTGAVAGRTNRHVLAQTGGVLGAAVLGAGAATATSNAPTSTQSALEADAAAGAAQQISPIATQYLNVQPTVTLAAGQTVSLLLTAPLEIPNAS